MNSLDDGERRRYPRVPTTRDCWIAHDNVTVQCPVEDVSEGGLRLRSPVNLETGTPVDVILDLGGSHGCLWAAGRVAWTEEDPEAPEHGPSHATGVELTHLRHGATSLLGFLLVSCGLG